MVLSQQMFAIWKLNPKMVKRIVKTRNARTVENQSKNGTEREREKMHKKIIMHETIVNNMKA